MKREIRSAVITGATGMIGANLTRVLLEKGIRVYCVIRPGSLKRKNLPEASENLEIIELDMQEISKLSLKNADAFFHFAWAGTYGADRNDEVLQLKNVENTLEAMETAKRLGAKVFIGAGSQAEYGIVEGKLDSSTPLHPVTAYGKGKLIAETESRQRAEELAIDHIWTRILSVYGPYDNDYTLVMSAVRAFLNDREIQFTKGEQIWDYLYAKDCGRMFYHLALSGISGKAYVIGSGKTKTLREYIEKIGEKAAPDRKITFGERPYFENQVMHLEADIREFVQDTGYTPDTPFSEGIQETVEFVKERNSK